MTMLDADAGKIAWSLVPDCPCWKCDEDRRTKNPPEWPLGLQRRMIVCENCGNKRCPHATDHTMACTRSNAPNQAGSRYSNGEYALAITGSKYGSVP